MTRRLLLAVLSLLALASCLPQEASVWGTPTWDPLRPYLDASSSRGTAQAAAATADYYSALLTATPLAQQATATERAWVVRQTQVAAEITSTARSAEWTATADSVQATSTAAATQTAQSIELALTANAATTTASANEANRLVYTAAMEAEVERVQQAVERDRQTNTLKALAPWAALALVFPVTLFLLYQRGRVMVVRRDERGDAPLLADVVDGVVSDPDRQFHPQGGLRRGDLKLLDAPTPALQAGVTERDQMLDLATRPGSGDGERRRDAGRRMADAERPAAVTVVPPDEMAARLQDVLPPLMLETIEGEVEDGGRDAGHPAA